MSDGYTVSLCVLGSGMNAGLFFAFSTFVMRALARIPDASGIAAMQSINSTILMPAFAILFFGTALVCMRVVILDGMRTGTPGAALRLAGALFFLGGVIVVTITCNVPLNDALAAVAPDSAEGAALWSRYLTRWTAFNHVRTVAAMASTVCFVLSMRAAPLIAR